MSTHEAAKRSEARSKGLRLAAKVATVGGFAFAALGLAEARAASASPAPIHAVVSDDAKALPLEGLKVTSGNCGCAPCWGPPAPPAKSARTARRARAASRKPARKRGAR